MQDLSKLNLKPIVERMATDFLTKAQQEGYNIMITEGFRSFERQTQLYNQIPKVTNAKAGESFHNYGCAFDVCFIVDGKESWNGDWQGIANIAKDCGLSWGGDWTGGFVDKPHFEYTAGYTIHDFINNKVDWSKFN